RRYCRPAALQLPQSRHCLNGPVSPDTSAIHQNRRRAEKIALTFKQAIILPSFPRSSSYSLQREDVAQAQQRFVFRFGTDAFGLNPRAKF
ncbi:hypothetical protein QCM77_45060, partial [Bradyrhizobium sp. SSUT18]|uniref:hypothetical protein n=1 Tax=Bradyrhizobium sp. SSUT18 TaxID=3040602 RepID=UPI00244A66C8